MRIAIARAGLILLGLTAPIAGRELSVTASGEPLDRATAGGAPKRQPAVAFDWGQVGAIAARDPFRAERRPAQALYDPIEPVTQGPPAPPPPPKPILRLTGMVWGAEPTALIEGLPGVEGARVVREGELIGGIRVIRVGRAAVVVEGMDTVWTLTVREGWH